MSINTIQIENPAIVSSSELKKNRIDIEKDINDSMNCSLVRVNEPAQLTPFRTVIAKERFEHYRRWTDIVYADKKEFKSKNEYKITIDKTNYKTINCIDGALLVLEIADYSDNMFLRIFSKYNKLSIRIGEIILLDCRFDALLEIFKMHRSAYDTMIDSLNTFKRLVIPIHEFVLRGFLYLSYFIQYDHNYVIDVHIGNVHIKDEINYCYLNYEAVQTVERSYRTSTLCGLEQIFYDHAYEYYEFSEDEFKIPLKGNELIRDISIKIISGYASCVSLDARPLTKTTDPYYIHHINKHLPKCDISFIFSSTLTRFCDKKDVYSGYIQGKNKHILVKNDYVGEKVKMLMVIRYDNFFQNNGTTYFKYGYNPKTDLCNNNYPLTKINDKEYIEGYWKDIYHYNSPGSKYPFPPVPLKGATDVDAKFLDKIKNIIKDGKIKKDEDDKHPVLIHQYLGSSTCRLCDCSNGNEEYEVTNDEGINFKFPSGLMHYYIEHKVQPSREFYDFIMSYNLHKEE